MRRLHHVSDAVAGSPAAKPELAAAAAPEFDTIICGGTVVDPANGVNGLFDVAISGGVIAAVEPAGGALSAATASEIHDASGQLVMPGLVDLHSHGFRFFDAIGIDFDTQCLGRCTTTAVDAGSSGASNFGGFKHYVIDACQTRVLCLLNISLIVSLKKR